MHYRGLLRIARRDNGTRVYAVRDAATEFPDAATAAARFDQLIDVVVHKYAPLPAPAWDSSRACCAGACHSGHAIAQPRWSAPSSASPMCASTASTGIGRQPSRPPRRAGGSMTACACSRLSILSFGSPPIRNTLGMGVSLRSLHAGSEAQARLLRLPILQRDRVIGWGNLAVREGALHGTFGYVSGSPPADSAFRDALDAELTRLGLFLTARPDRSRWMRRACRQVAQASPAEGIRTTCPRDVSREVPNRRDSINRYGRFRTSLDSRVGVPECDRAHESASGSVPSPPTARR